MRPQKLGVLEVFALSLLSSAAMLGCSVPAAAPVADGGDERGPLGKADAAGSCSFDDGNYCGGKSAAACWCDDLCEMYGDCCSDYQGVCLGEDTTGDDSGSSTSGETTGGDDGAGSVDVEGELVFQVTELAGGWHQYYQGNVQYRPAGVFSSTSIHDDGSVQVFHQNGYASAFVVKTGAEGTWTDEILNPGAGYYVTDLAGAIDGNANPVALIAGRVFTNYPSSEPAVHVFTYDGYKWHKHVPFTQLAGSTYPEAAALAVDDDGTIHVVYSGYTPAPHNYVDGVMYAKYDGTAWSQELIETLLVPRERRSLDLQLDAQGQPHVAYVQEVDDPGPNDTPHIIKHAVREAGVWNTSVAESYILARAQIDLAVTSGGKPFIVFSDDKNSDVFATELVDGAWVREKIASTGDVGWAASVAVDDLGRPHVSWYDKSTRHVGYGRRLESGWDLYPQAMKVNIGHIGYPNEAVGTDVVVDGDRLPHITAGSFDLVSVAGARQ